MSESDAAKQAREYQAELSGELRGLRAGTIAAEHVENKVISKKEQQKRSQDALELLLQLCEQAHSDLMHQINFELDAIHLMMDKNRKDWELRANRLENIDELLQAVKDGKKLDKEKAKQIIKSASQSLPENATNADYLTLLIAIKNDDLKHIERLDTDFQNLEERERFYKDMKKKVQDIANNDSLDVSERLDAYQKLNNEMGSVSFTKTALEADNTTQQNEMDNVANQIHKQEVQNNGSFDFSKANF